MFKTLSELKQVFSVSDLRSVIFFVTGNCNLRCRFCFYSANLNRHDDLSLEQIRTIARTTGPFWKLLVSGGEPFLRTDLVEILSEFRRYCGIETIDLPTNGWYTDRIVSTVEEFCTRHPDVQLTITISLDAMGDLHDRLRQAPGCFERAVGTLKALSGLKLRFPRLRTVVCSVLTQENARSLGELFDFVRDHLPEADEHSVEIERDSDRTTADFGVRRGLTDDLMRLVLKSLAIVRARVRRPRRNRGVPVAVSRLMHSGMVLTSTRLKIARIHGKLWPFRCVAGRSIVVINSRGELSPCELRPEKIDLARYGYDVGQAMRSSEFAKTTQRIVCERCDCTHSTFLVQSMRQSGLFFLTRVPLAGLVDRWDSEDPHDPVAPPPEG